MKEKIRRNAAILTISGLALLGIATHEGYREKAYRDVTGVPTVGYGETKGITMNSTMTRLEAFQRLAISADEHAEGMVRCIKVPISQGEFDAYLSFTYNVGVGAFCRSTLVKKLNNMDYDGACKELLRWTQAGGKVYPGLVRRRQEEYNTCIGA
jgi:lysozyme